MTRRWAFTLVEVMVALVVTGMVAALAYAAAGAGLSTQAQLDRYREGEGHEAVVRALLSTAFRHQLEGLRGSGEVFALVNRTATDGTPADSLHLTTRGVRSPLGTSEAWTLDAWRAGDTVHVEARPVRDASALRALDAAAPDAGVPPIRAQLRGIRAFDVQVLGRGPVAPWRADWPEGDVAPDATLVLLAHEDRSERRLLMRRGLERAP